jgi:hypothetical protein
MPPNLQRAGRDHLHFPGFLLEIGLMPSTRSTGLTRTGLVRRIPMENATRSALWGLPLFLLIYRDRRGVSAIIIEAASLAAAQAKAATAGLDTPNSFRMGQKLDAELITVVRSEQVGRILPVPEAKELLALFKAPRLHNLGTRQRRGHRPAALRH